MSKKSIPAIRLEANVSVWNDAPDAVHRSSLLALWEDDTHRYHIWINTKTLKLDDVIHRNPLDLKANGHRALDASAKTHETIMGELRKIVTKENAEKAFAEAEAIELHKTEVTKRNAAQRVRVALEDVREDILPAHIKAHFTELSDEQILRFAAFVRAS